MRQMGAARDKSDHFKHQMQEIEKMTLENQEHGKQMAWLVNMYYNSDGEQQEKFDEMIEELKKEHLDYMEEKNKNVKSERKQTSKSLVEFLAAYEGFSPTPYRGADSQNLTIGYGHVIRPGETYTSITKEDALELKLKDIESFVEGVNRITKDIELNQQQFDSLVSFAYNCGLGALESSTLLKKIKKGNATPEEIEESFSVWSYCNGKRLLGLWRRRMDEAEMFNEGCYTRDDRNW